MTLIRRPLDRDHIPFRDALDRIFGEWSLGALQGGITGSAPPLDVRETDDAYIVEVELPGVDPKETEVSIEGRTLTVRGQFADEVEKQEGNVLLRERRRGRFLRAVALPGMVEVNKVTSRYENGELTITLPKATQDRARRVEIEAANGRSDATGRSDTAGRSDTSGRSETGRQSS